MGRHFTTSQRSRSDVFCPADVITPDEQMLHDAKAKAVETEYERGGSSSSRGCSRRARTRLPSRVVLDRYKRDDRAGLLPTWRRDRDRGAKSVEQPPAAFVDGTTLTRSVGLQPVGTSLTQSVGGPSSARVEHRESSVRQRP